MLALLRSPVKDLVAAYPGVLTLTDLLDKPFSELSHDDIARVMQVFGLEGKLTPDLERAFRAFLKGQNLSAISDCVRDPESIGRLVQAIRALFRPTDTWGVGAGLTLL